MPSFCTLTPSPILLPYWTAHCPIMFLPLIWQLLASELRLSMLGGWRICLLTFPSILAHPLEIRIWLHSACQFLSFHCWLPFSDAHCNQTDSCSTIRSSAIASELLFKLFFDGFLFELQVLHLCFFRYHDGGYRFISYTGYCRLRNTVTGKRLLTIMLKAQRQIEINIAV